ncbi:MAG: GNAT family N-acetyltransferase [Rhodospirillaceae bacterium]|nr:GNAT family N-acetyltransferase [Rhodospirillaceae bacterium]
MPQPAHSQIRPYRSDDAPALSALYRRSVEVLGPRHYTPAQVAAWASLTPDPEAMHARCAGPGRAALVAVDAADRPVAFAVLESDGHIDLFYAAPEAAGSGTATALLCAVEGEARELGGAALHVEASEGARSLFLKRGFATVARRDFEVGNVAIHNYAMRKPS